MPHLPVQVQGQRGFPASCSLPVADGEWVRVRSRRGVLEGRSLVSAMVKEGELFVPFVKLAQHAANFLTNNVLDPSSKIPEYKVCAVRLEKTGADPGRPKT
ncbi:MAG: molybdopterin dinucleotide binding domain-containing protein [Dehalococcoidia bacterium]